MTQAEKQAFLADVHVGVLALNDGDRGPLMVPMWYEYEPGGELWFLTDPQTRKGRLIQNYGSIPYTIRWTTIWGEDWEQEFFRPAGGVPS